ncbi:MAG: hypothetical protein K2G10_04180, partial [Alistipes sp.]|nr:hypothetical protein [Alistipes sp.]
APASENSFSGLRRLFYSLRSTQSSSKHCLQIMGLRGEEVFYFKGRPASAPHFESPSLRKQTDWFRSMNDFGFRAEVFFMRKTPP